MNISRENLIRLQAIVGIVVIFGAFFALLAIAKAFRTYDVDYYDGSVCLHSVEVRNGEKAEKYETVSSDGRELDKWVTADGTEFDFDTPIKKDTKLYAEWK